MTGIFQKLFAAAEIAQFTPEELDQYEDSLKIYRDLHNSIETARTEGKAETKVEVARNLLRENLPIELVARSTGLPLEEVQALADALNTPAPNKVSATPKPFKAAPRAKAGHASRPKK